MNLNRRARLPSPPVRASAAVKFRQHSFNTKAALLRNASSFRTLRQTSPSALGAKTVIALRTLALAGKRDLYWYQLSAPEIILAGCRCGIRLVLACEPQEAALLAWEFWLDLLRIPARIIDDMPFCT
jgi:hypothetical protein